MPTRRQPGARTWTNRPRFRTHYIKGLLQHIERYGQSPCYTGPLSKQHMVDWHLVGEAGSVSALNRYLEWWGDGFPAWNDLVYGFNHAPAETEAVLRQVADLIEREPAIQVPELLGRATTPEWPRTELEARRALDLFDDHLAAFLSNHPRVLLSTVTVKQLARDSHVDRKHYYRLLRQAGVGETPLTYIRRRLPELRARLNAAS